MVTDPYLDAGMRGWIVNTARENFWRVPEYYELYDLINDGYFCYYKCHRRYRFLTVKRHPFPEDKARFMALVQAAFRNHITTLANKRTAVNERPMSQFVAEGESEAAAWTDILPAQPEEATLAVLLKDAPAEMLTVLKTLASDTSAATDFVRSRLRRHKVGETDVRVRRYRRRLRETTNEWLCRLANCDPLRVDLAGTLRAYLETA